jgi:hypothetical protein
MPKTILGIAAALACFAGRASAAWVAAVDGYHNNEKEPHYRWEGTYPGGYSKLGELLRDLGAETRTLSEPFTAKSLRGLDLLIVADPDIPAEAADPRYFSPDEAAAAEQWVKAGGTLVLFGNDPGNAEFKHFNGLARRFGIDFQEKVHKEENGLVKLAITAPPNHRAFPGGLTFYAVQVAPLAVTTKDAEVLLANNGAPLMVLVRHGKGQVLALGDPWIYNEYIGTRDNYRIAESLFRFLRQDRLLGDVEQHPLRAKIGAFLKRQDAFGGFRPSGLARADYLRVIEGQVRAMRGYQNAAGRIVDPVHKAEFAFATPCYAHAVAALAAGGRIEDTGLLESGMRAMDAAVADMAAGAAPDNHGDFFTYPVLLALRLYEPRVPAARSAGWRKSIAQLEPGKFYKANKPGGNNWNLVNTAGEYLRFREGMTDPDYFESCLRAHLPVFSALGMFNERGNPLAYDHFSRYFLSGILQLGYRGASHGSYRDLMWKGAWTSMFLQSPAGELAAGYRSAHHIWNEAQAAAIYEVYARQYALAGRSAQAGAFRRAAMLSLRSVMRWIRPDGSGYIVKNRYPIEARHGYETYSKHSTYNLLASSMLAAAWSMALDEIAERPAPADVGGYVVPILEPFHKIFASAGGSYVEYDTRGDHVYNATGLIRVHVRGGNPQLGPSDACSALFSGKDVDVAVGPAWRDARGVWRSLAEMSPDEPRIEILSEGPDKAAFAVDYAAQRTRAGDVLLVHVREVVTVRPGHVTVESSVSGDGVRGMRVTYPMLVYDGLERTAIRLENSAALLYLRDGGVRFEVLEPPGTRLQRSGTELGHRSGMVEPAFADVDGSRVVYRISGAGPVLDRP